MMIDPAIFPVWGRRERFECSRKIESGNVNWAQSSLCLYMVLRVPMPSRHDRLCSGDAIGQGCGMSCKSYMPRRTNSMWSSQDKTLVFLGLLFITPAAQADTCTITEHPSCTISCTAGCIASWVEPAGCATRCSEAEGVKTVKMVIQNASSKEIGNFMKSREFLRSFKQR
jgi:hypothetical protein